MDDILKRLGNVEADVSELKSEVRGISAVIPHLATKADLKAMETKIIEWIIATTLTVAALAFSAAKLIH